MKNLTEMMALVESLTTICVDSASAESAEELTEYIDWIKEGKYALQAALAELIAERDALKSQLDDYTLMMAEKEADAARYQWLRNAPNLYRDHKDVYSALVEGFTAKEIDSAIDAAMKGTS